MARYRPLLPLVNAVRFHGGAHMPRPVCTCTQWAGQPHIHHVDGLREINRGDWIVTDSDGVARVIDAHTFAENFRRERKRGGQ